MKDFFEQAIQAAQHGEQLSGDADIQAFKDLIGKSAWSDADLDATTDLWQRAKLDPHLNEQMETLQREWLQREGLAVTLEDAARAQKMVQHIIKQWKDEKP